jgi:hypothetical protein
MSNWAMLRFSKYEYETAKAYLVKLHQTEIWLPKRFCRNFITNKKLGGNVQIPEWLYKEKLGYEPPEEDYTYTVTKHTPEKILPKENNLIPRLKK